MVYAEVSCCIHGERNISLSNRPVMTEAQWQRFAVRISGMASYLQSQGMKMAYHHHMGTVIETEEEVDRLMEVTGPDLALLLDTGHLTYAGGDPLAVLKRHGARIVHIHCKDVRPFILDRVREADSSFLAAVCEGVFTVPGDGFIDYLALAAELKSQNYSGWLVVEAEQDPTKANPLTYATKGYQHLADVVAVSGL
jgi:inosose dehydratase